MRFVVEKTDYLDIEVDAEVLIKEFADEFSEFEGSNEDFIKEVLYEFDFADLCYSGGGIEVLNSDSDYLIKEVKQP